MKYSAQRNADKKKKRQMRNHHEDGGYNVANIEGGT
jgi:hypothetical protein